MAIIETDNPEIEKELKKLEALVEEGGGGTHSDLLIHTHQDGGLSIETKEPMPPGKEIIRLSRDILLPADQYNVSIKNGQFDVQFPKNSNLSTLQKKLTENMIALYNLTDKVALHKKLSFLLSIFIYPELVDLLAKGRLFGNNMRQWAEKAEKDLHGEVLDQFVSETFLKTRHLGYNDHFRTSSVSILMPIVDFMNHHWQGAAFNVGTGVRQGDLAVTANQVVDGNNECYAFYGIMDAFDTLVRYDFVDDFAPVVRSIPLELEVPDYGVIKVNSFPGAINKKKLPEKLTDLSRFVPVMTLNGEEKSLSITHLIIPTNGSPRALRRILYVLLVNLIGKEAEESLYAPWLRESERKIIEENSRYYKKLLDLLDKLIQENGSNPGLDRVHHMAKLQMKKLSAYIYLDDMPEHKENRASVSGNC